MIHESDDWNYINHSQNMTLTANVAPHLLDVQIR